MEQRAKDYEDVGYFMQDGSVVVGDLCRLISWCQVPRVASYCTVGFYT
jgi:hypothetical protein